MPSCKRSCCIPSCNKNRAEKAVLHLFPNPKKDKERFMAWVNAVGMSISSLDHNFIYINRRVCHDHFENKYLTWSNRLSNVAVPTLLIPGYQEKNVVRNFTKTNNLMAMHSYKPDLIPSMHTDESISAKETKQLSCYNKLHEEIQQIGNFVEVNPEKLRGEVNLTKQLKEDVTDEYDDYGKYVASELRNIKDEDGYSTVIAKQYINNVLNNARTGKYRINLRKGQCLVLEDAINRVKGARAVGIQVVMVPDKRNDRSLTIEA